MNRWANTVLAFFLTVNGWSYHADRSVVWNEKNNIIGFEYKHKNGSAIECITYHNSIFRNSNACGAIIGSGNLKLKMGGVTGYSDGVTPYLLPTIVYQYKTLKFELSIVPAVYILMIKMEI
jgi:hypothetical protein